jgi:hypothetical protein
MESKMFYKKNTIHTAKQMCKKYNYISVSDIENKLKIEVNYD